MKKKVELSDYDKLCESLYKICIDSLGDTITILDAMDALSIVKNHILSESIHVDIEMGLEYLLKTKIKELKHISEKTPENHGVCA